MVELMTVDPLVMIGPSPPPSKRLYSQLAQLLDTFPDAAAAAAWAPEVSGPLLKGSAPGVPETGPELLAQLMLGNVLQRSPVLVRRETLIEFDGLKQADGTLDEHLLWLSLSVKDRIATMVVADEEIFSLKAEASTVSPRRLDIIRRYWECNPNGVEVVERALSLDPSDEGLWNLYSQGLEERWREDLPEVTLDHTAIPTLLTKWPAAEYCLECAGSIFPKPRQTIPCNSLFSFVACHPAKTARSV